MKVSHDKPRVKFTALAPFLLLTSPPPPTSSPPPNVRQNPGRAQRRGVPQPPPGAGCHRSAEQRCPRHREPPLSIPAAAERCRTKRRAGTTEAPGSAEPQREPGAAGARPPVRRHLAPARPRLGSPQPPDPRGRARGRALGPAAAPPSGRAASPGANKLRGASVPRPRPPRALLTLRTAPAASPARSGRADPRLGAGAPPRPGTPALGSAEEAVPARGRRRWETFPPGCLPFPPLGASSPIAAALARSLARLERLRRPSAAGRPRPPPPALLRRLRPPPRRGEAARAAGRPPRRPPRLSPRSGPIYEARLPSRVNVPFVLALAAAEALRTHGQRRGSEEAAKLRPAARGWGSGRRDGTGTSSPGRAPRPARPPAPPPPRSSRFSITIRPVVPRSVATPRRQPQPGPGGGGPQPTCKAAPPPARQGGRRLPAVRALRAGRAGRPAGRPHLPPRHGGVGTYPTPGPEGAGAAAREGGVGSVWPGSIMGLGGALATATFERCPLQTEQHSLSSCWLPALSFAAVYLPFPCYPRGRQSCLRHPCADTTAIMAAAKGTTESLR